jgi:hypothetical protein
LTPPATTAYNAVGNERPGRAVSEDLVTRLPQQLRFVSILAAALLVSGLLAPSLFAVEKNDLPKWRGRFPLRWGDIPQEGGPQSRFIKGTNADAFGRGEELPPISVAGDPETVKIEYPPEPVEKPQVSPDVIYTRILATSFSDASLPLKGHVGDDSLLPEYFPSYRRGWETGVGGGIQIGFDAGIVGFYVEAGYRLFKSKGMTFTGSGGWFRYSDIRILTLTPGFKLQLPDWMKYLYAGNTAWEVSWFDYLLHSFPYVKFGVGPMLHDSLEAYSDTSTTKVEYWKDGLSYTFFFAIGLEWRPFGKHASAFIEGGIQSFVFPTVTAFAKSPDWLTTLPIRLGIAVNF